MSDRLYLAARMAVTQLARPGTEKKVDGVVRRVLARGLEESNLRAVVVYQVTDTWQVFICPGEESWLASHGHMAPKSHVWALRPALGSHWRHFRGQTYRVAANAIHVATRQPYVIYKADSDHVVWARSLDAWLSTAAVAGRVVGRFALIP